MSKLLIGSIDLTKVDKEKLYDGKFLNVSVWINDELDKYGNIASVQQSISKEERDAGKKAAYIGNLKTVESAVNKENEDNSSLPF